MSRRAHAYVFAALALVLVGLHFDRWNDHRVEPWALGWMPADLAYHVGWVIAATALIFYLCARVWPEPGAGAGAARGGSPSAAVDGEEQQRGA